MAEGTFIITDDNALLIKKIQTVLDGIPSVLEMAASRVSQISLENIADNHAINCLHPLSLYITERLTPHLPLRYTPLMLFKAY